MITLVLSEHMVRFSFKKQHKQQSLHVHSDVIGPEWSLHVVVTMVPYMVGRNMKHDHCSKASHDLCTITHSVAGSHNHYFLET